MGECPTQYSCQDCPQPLDNFYINNEEINSLAVQIVSASIKHPINAILEWIHLNIPYASDLEIYGSLEYWAYPMETVGRGMGDCDDSSFLCASLLESIGYNTRVCIGPTPSGYHMWVECQDMNGCWWLLETTLGRAYKMTSRASLGYQVDYYVTSHSGCEDFQDAFIYNP